MTDTKTPLEHFQVELASAESMIAFLRGEIVKKEESIGGYETKIGHLKAAIAALESQ